MSVINSVELFDHPSSRLVGTVTHTCDAAGSEEVIESLVLIDGDTVSFGHYGGIGTAGGLPTLGAACGCEQALEATLSSSPVVKTPFTIVAGWPQGVEAALPAERPVASYKDGRWSSLGTGAPVGSVNVETAGRHVCPAWAAQMENLGFAPRKDLTVDLVSPQIATVLATFAKSPFRHASELVGPTGIGKSAAVEAFAAAAGAGFLRLTATIGMGVEDVLAGGDFKDGRTVVQMKPLLRLATAQSCADLSDMEGFDAQLECDSTAAHPVWVEIAEASDMNPALRRVLQPLTEAGRNDLHLDVELLDPDARDFVVNPAFKLVFTANPPTAAYLTERRSDPAHVRRVASVAVSSARADGARQADIARFGAEAWFEGAGVEDGDLPEALERFDAYLGVFRPALEQAFDEADDASMPSHLRPTGERVREACGRLSLGDDELGDADTIVDAAFGSACWTSFRKLVSRWDTARSCFERWDRLERHTEVCPVWTELTRKLGFGADGRFDIELVAPQVRSALSALTVSPTATGLTLEGVTGAGKSGATAALANLWGAAYLPFTANLGASLDAIVSKRFDGDSTESVESTLLALLRSHTCEDLAWHAGFGTESALGCEPGARHPIVVEVAESSDLRPELRRFFQQMENGAASVRVDSAAADSTSAVSLNPWTRFVFTRNPVSYHGRRPGAALDRRFPPVQVTLSEADGVRQINIAKASVRQWLTDVGATPLEDAAAAAAAWLDAWSPIVSHLYQVRADRGSVEGIGVIDDTNLPVAEHLVEAACQIALVGDVGSDVRRSIIEASMGSAPAEVIWAIEAYV